MLRNPLNPFARTALHEAVLTGHPPTVEAMPWLGTSNVPAALAMVADAVDGCAVSNSTNQDKWFLGFTVRLRFAMKLALPGVIASWIGDESAFSLRTTKG